MARNTNLAEVSEGTAPYGLKKDGTPRKRPAIEGPRSPKPVRFVFKTTDEEGTEVPNAKIEVLYSGKDADEAYTIKEQNPGASIQRVTLQRGSES